MDIIIANLESDGMTHKDAVDYFYFNIEGAHMGEKTPIYASLIKRSITNNGQTRRKFLTEKQ
jgi:hypothetical protein